MSALKEIDSENPDANDEDTDDEDDEVSFLSMHDDDAPAKAQNQIRNAFNEPIKKNRRVVNGPDSTHMPDLLKMTSTGKAGRAQDSLQKPYDNDFVIKAFAESSFPRNSEMNSFIDKKISQRARMTKEIEGILNNLGSSIDISRPSILSETSNEDGIVEIDLEELGDSNKNE